jgi:hypothetical protein
MKVYLIGHATTESTLQELVKSHARMRRRKSLILYQKMNAEFSSVQEEETSESVKPYNYAIIFSMIGLIAGMALSLDFWGKI